MIKVKTLEMDSILICAMAAAIGGHDLLVKRLLSTNIASDLSSSSPSDDTIVKDSSTISSDSLVKIRLPISQCLWEEMCNLRNLDNADLLTTKAHDICEHSPQCELLLVDVLYGAIFGMIIIF